jgi:hypothetical protein
MTVILDWKGEAARWVVPGPPQRCSVCADPLRAPFMHWSCSVRLPDVPGEPPDVYATEDFFVCAECCRSHGRGFMADMTRVADIHRALEAKPEACPTLRTTQ